MTDEPEEQDAPATERREPRTIRIRTLVMYTFAVAIGFIGNAVVQTHLEKQRAQALWNASNADSRPLFDEAISAPQPAPSLG